MLKPFIKISLRTKLLIVMMVIALTPLILFNNFSLRESEKILVEKVFQRDQVMAEGIAKEIDQMFAENIRMVKVAAQNPDIRSMNVEGLVSALSPMPANHPELLMAIALSANGDLLARSDGKQVKANYRDRDYFHTAKRTGKTTISDVLVSKTTGKLDIGIAEPVKDSDQTFLGMVVVGVSLNNVVNLIAKRKIGEGGYVFVVNREGKVLIPQDSEHLMASSDVSDLAPVKAAINGQSGALEYEFKGKRFLAGFSFVPSTGWGLIVQQPFDEAMASVRTLKDTNITIMIVTMMGSVVCIFILAGIIFKPVGQLIAASGRVAKGDFSVKISVKSADEIGELAEAFNHMTKELMVREEALQQSQEKYRRIVDTSNEGIVVLDKHQCISFANTRFAQMLNYQVDELVGLDIRSLLFEEDFDDHEKVIEERHKGISSQYERRWKHRDSRIIWAITSGTAVMDKMQNFDGTIAMVTDITRRKETEEENKRLTDRLLLATSSAGLGIWDWNVRDNSMVWDDRMFELYGVTREGTPSNADAWINGLHPEDKESALAACQAALNGEKDFDIEFRVLRPDGTVKHLKANGLVIMGADRKPDRMLGINADITKQKQAEAEKSRLENRLQQSEKIESIGQLAGGIAHDFNNLLSVIINNLELLKTRHKSGTPFEENVTQIMQASTQAKDLVTQILTFSRQETPVFVAADLSIVIYDAMVFLRAMIPSTVEVMTELSAGHLPVQANKTQLHQVLINLCNNAVHAMNERGLLQIKLDEVELTSRDDPRISGTHAGRYAKLSVIDTGKGMDKETLERIFDPFFTTKEVGVGTGMGLSVVHGIVEQHGGFILADSTPGHGSTFNLYFPLTSIAAETDITTGGEDLPTGTERILFVDDEPSVADSCGALLEDLLGYKVTVMTDCLKALYFFAANPHDFDLVITDQTMPKMSGVELAKELLSIRKDVPIILCSGYSAQVSEDAAKQVGISAFCMKPLLMKDLALVVREVLDTSG